MISMAGIEQQRKEISVNVSNAEAKFCLNFHYNGDNSYLFVNGREIQV